MQLWSGHIWLWPSALSDRVARELRFYDGLTHRGMFSIPKYLREEMAANKRIITKDEPLFTY